jgi:hypothetical protein
VRRSEYLVGAGIGAAASLVVAPALELAAQSAAGNAHVLEVFEGALTATIFFAISAVMGALFQRTPYFMMSVLGAYVAKIVLVFLVVRSLSLSTEAGKVFGLSVATSALAYLTFQTIYIAKWRRAWWVRRTS